MAEADGRGLERAFFLAAGQKGSAVPEMVESSLLSLNPVPLPFWLEDREGGKGCVATLPPQGSVKEKAPPPLTSLWRRARENSRQARRSKNCRAPFFILSVLLPNITGGKFPNRKVDKSTAEAFSVKVSPRVDGQGGGGNTSGFFLSITFQHF